MKYVITFTIFSVLLLAKNEYDDLTWGTGIVARSASIPYYDPVVIDDTLNDFVPLFYYEDDYVYLHGLTYGFKLYALDNWQFSALGRVRFLNIPQEYQNEVQGDTMDYGLRARYFLYDNQYIDLEVMENPDNSTHANLTYSANLKYGDLYVEPHTTLRVKDATFNTQHYGQDKEKIKADFDLAAGLDLKYHLWSNFYLIGSADINWLGNNVQKSSIIDEDYEYTLMGGFGLLNDKNKKYFDVDGMKPYIRLAHGWATLSNLEDILIGDIESDDYNNQSTSIFYGHPLSKTFFNLPLEVYLTPGLAYHYSSEVQESTLEYILGFKLYYTLPLPDIDMRLGLGEGVSYMDEVIYIEKSEIEGKGLKPSSLTFYLDVSVDLNLGFLHDDLNPLWIGAAIHHRSSGFEEVSLFGRLKSGSNYNTVYLQWHF
jgi:outer membrane protein